LKPFFLTLSFQEKLDLYLKQFLFYLLLGLVIAIPFFWGLDTLPIQTWDESRNAINAVEMNKSNNFIVTFFEGQPDMWNTKPPLLIWLQVLFLKIIGINEWAIRLPSAIASFFTCLTLFVFSVKILKSKWKGVFIVLILVTIEGFIGFHASRTGDFDALLTFFTTAAALFFYCYVELKKTKYLYLFFIATAMAVLSKSIVGLLFFPSFVIYLFIKNEFVPLIKNKHLYFSLLLFVIISLPYYLVREAHNNGYIKAVYENELGGRFLKTIEQHEQGFFFYIKNVINIRLKVWFLFLPLAIITGLTSKVEIIKSISIFSTTLSFGFLLIISYISFYIYINWCFYTLGIRNN